MDDKKKFEELTDLDLLKCFAWQSKAMNCAMIHYTCNEFKVNHNPIDIKLKPLKVRADSDIKHGFAELPMEVHLKILLYLNIQTLGRIRLANSHLKTVVDRIPEYGRVRKHAYDAIRAMRDTKTILYHSLKTVYQVLTRGACVDCGKFGPFVSVLTFERCCYDCLVGLWDRILGHRLHFGLVAITRERWHPPRSTLEAEYMQKARSMVCPANCFNCDTHRARFGRSPLHEVEDGARMFSHNLIELLPPGRQSIKCTKPYCLDGAVRMPVLDNGHRRVEHGIMCGGCRPNRDGFSYLDLPQVSTRAWTVDTFLEHVKTCRRARQQWDELSPHHLRQFLFKEHRLPDWSFLPKTEPEQNNLDEYSGWSKSRPFRVLH